MSQQAYSRAVETARNYYNSTDADNFYFHVWGGEDIHIGLYRGPDEDDIFQAGRRTVARMAQRLATTLTPECRVLDIGAGYAGSMRFLADTFGCRSVALNLSEVENERAREINRRQGLDPLVEVVDGSFEELPFDDASFDVVWSQDAMLHSGDRGRVVAETARVLRPGGEFVFTDPMQADDCPPDVLQPILERILLDTLGSPAFYQQACADAGLELLEFEDHSDQLPLHYAAVLRATEQRQRELEGLRVSHDYLERMKKGLGHWVEGGRRGHLTWGIFQFRRTSA